MKRLMAFLFVMNLLFSLTGCMGRESDRRFMVAALGFSETEKGIKISAETIVVNSEISEEAPKSQVLTGEGKTIKAALQNISSKLTRPILLEHCGVIVLDKDISEVWFDEICDYCFNERKITLSAYMIASDNPEKLLSAEPLSSVAVGYDIMSLTEQTEKNKEFKNRFFEIESKRLKGETKLSLPLFKREKELIKITDSVDFKSGGVTDDRS